MSDQHPDPWDQEFAEFRGDPVLGTTLLALIDCGSVYAAKAKEVARKIAVLKSAYPPNLPLSSWPKPALTQYMSYLNQAGFYWRAEQNLIIPRSQLHFQAGFHNLISEETTLHFILEEKVRACELLEDLVGQHISMAEEREKLATQPELDDGVAKA